MSRPGNKNSSKLAFYCMLVCIGVVGGFILFWVASNAFQFQGFDQWSFSTDPVNAIISILTLLAAFTILRRLQHQDDTSAKIRDLFAQYLSEFREDYRKTIISLVNSSSIDFQFVIQRITRFKRRAIMLIELGEDHNLLEKTFIQSLQLKDAISEMRDLLTDTLATGSVAGIPPISASGGKMSYSQQRVTEIADQVYKTEKMIFSITALIHR